jgi:hypothetical protein
MEMNFSYSSNSAVIEPEFTEQDELTLEVLDPKGVLASPEVSGLKNPRVGDLNGKRIALLAEKPDSILFFNAIEKMLQEAYPTAIILRYPSPADPARPDNTVDVTNTCDVWLQGVKTSTSSRVDYDVKMEKLGKPGAMFSVDSLVGQKRCVAEINGIPTIRVITLPALEYFKAKADQELMNVVAFNAFNDTIRALTEPLTYSEQYPAPFHYDYSPKKFTGNSYKDVYESFLTHCAKNSWYDGLPVMPPTRAAVDEMLTGTSYPPDKEIGIVLPRGGIATVEKIAISAVMAGAKPEYLPVIIAVIECITDKNFNQFHINTGPLPVIWISGPIIEELGINNDIAYMSPGNRANSTIARAVAMCQINIGWRELSIYADPGGPGTPSNYTNYFVPENNRNNPWESYAVESGFKPDESIVSVSEVTGYFRGPGETLYYKPFEESLELMTNLIRPSALHYSMTSAEKTQKRYLIVLHPTFASQLADAGFTKRSLAQWLYDKTSVNWDNMSDDERRRLKEEADAGKWPGLQPEDCIPGLKLEYFSDPKHIAVLVAGNPAGSTLIFSTGTGSTAKMGDCDPDFVPRPFMYKVIHGATLTKAGR